jgi:predicted  nucleic acid-binding Zn-ribbon protein
MNISELAQKMNDVELVQMRFGSQQIVDVYDLIRVMANDPTKRKLTEDEWEEAKEQSVEVMEEFVTLRHEVAALKRNLQSYVRNHNDLERHFLETHGRQAYREFRAEMDKRHAEDARKNKPASKPAWKSHMWIKGE